MNKTATELKPQISIGDAEFDAWLREASKTFGPYAMAKDVARAAFKAGMAKGARLAAQTYNDAFMAEANAAREQAGNRFAEIPENLV